MNTKQRWCITRSTELAPRKEAIVMSWPCDLITWSYLSSSNNIPPNPHLLTTLSLLTSHILSSQNIILIKSAPAPITSRHLLAIPISPTSRCSVLTFPHPKPYKNRITLQSLVVEKGICNKTSLRWCLCGERDSSSQAPYPRNLCDKAKMHGTINAAKHGSLVSVQLFYERNQLHWYCSKAFTIKGN